MQFSAQLRTELHASDFHKTQIQSVGVLAVSGILYNLEPIGIWVASQFRTKVPYELSSLTLALRPGLIDIELRRALARIKLELKHYRYLAAYRSELIFTYFCNLFRHGSLCLLKTTDWYFNLGLTGFDRMYESVCQHASS